MPENTERKLNLKAFHLWDDVKSATKPVEARDETESSITRKWVATTQKDSIPEDKKISEKTQDTSLSKKISFTSLRENKDEEIKKNIPQPQEDKNILENTAGSNNESSSSKKLGQVEWAWMTPIAEKTNNETEEVITAVDTPSILDVANSQIEKKETVAVDDGKEKYEEIIAHSEVIHNTKTSKKWFWFFSRSKNKEKKATTLWNKENTDTEKKEVAFHNYTSSFEEQSVNVLKRIQNFKYAPKTRMSLVITLITLTSLCISSLMIVFPEKHNTQVYKASIIGILQKQNNTISDTQEFKAPTNIWNADTTATLPEGEISNQEQSQDTSMPQTLWEIEAQRDEENKEKIKNFILDKYSRD